MKARFSISVGWVVSTFLVLSWLLYAANNYHSRMLAAISGREGTEPTLERAKALEAQKLRAKTIEEVSDIQGTIVEELRRYGDVKSASLFRRDMIERAWILWGFMPLLFLWSSEICGLWRGTQISSAGQQAKTI